MKTDKAGRTAPLTPEKAYAQAAARCSVRECCRADWQQKWRRAGLSDEDTEKVLMQLEKEGFIDENRYARAFVHDKLNYEHWGRVKISTTLLFKGLSRSDISEALDTIDEEAYEQILKDVLTAKERTLKGVGGYEKKQKLARFAIGRGFEASLVFRWLNIPEEDETEFES